MDRANCFELFRKSYRKNEVMDDNKSILKSKYTDARSLGAIVNGARTRINDLKNQVKYYNHNYKFFRFHSNIQIKINITIFRKYSKQIPKKMLRCPPPRN